MAAVFVIVAGLVATWTAPALAIVTRTSATLTVPSSETVTDTFFGSGNNVGLSGHFMGDTFVAGGSVIVDGVVERNLIVIGGRVVIDGTVHGALVVAGGTVELRPGSRIEGNTYVSGAQVTMGGNTDGDAFVAGGQVTLDRSGAVGQSLATAAGNALVDGRIARDLLAYGARLVLTGEVDGSVRAQVDGLTIAPGAQVGGNVQYESRQQATIATGTVSGTVTRIEPVEPAQASPYAAVIGALITWLQGLVGLLLFGLTMMLIAPGLLTRSERRIETEPWRTLGVGAIATLAAPVAAGVMLFLGWFVGGWWIGVFILGGLVFGLVLGYVVTATFVARWLLERTGSDHNHPMLTMALGVVLVDFVSSIPFVGWVVAAAAAVFGIGAVIGHLFSRRTTVAETRAEEAGLTASAAGTDAD
jgi:cytoskeletal protein CcmA (bactofilin family)